MAPRPAVAVSDRVRRLARLLCRAPAARLTLVAAHDGGGPDPLGARVVATGLPLLLGDARRHPEAEPGVAAYAGVPVRGADGPVLGALAVTDTAPRTWAPAEVAALEDLAAGVVTELALRVSEQRAAAVLETALDAIVTMDADGRIVDFNPAAERTFGHARAAAVGRDLADLLIPADLVAAHRRGLAAHLATGATTVLGRRIEVAARCADGTAIPVELAITRSDAGERPSFVGYLRDLRPVRAAHAARADAERRSRSLIQQVVDAAPVALLAFDAEGTVTLAEGRPLRADAAAPVVGAPAAALAATLPHVEEELARARRGERFRSVVRAPGRVLEVSWSPMRDGDGGVEAVSAIALDVTERTLRDERVAHLAHHDQLTGLANRRKLEEHLDAALRRAPRTGQAVSVLSVDVDGFKVVNDGLGRAAGDALLRELADRLSGVVRGTDLVARQAGDEFAVVLEHAAAAAQDAAETVARKVLAALTGALVLDGTEVHLGVSVGVATATRDVRDGADLLVRAGTAMHEAKRGGGRGHAVWAPSGTDAHRRLTLPARILRGLHRDEFLLHFQPVAHLASGRVQACEALIRWQDPDRGLVAPGEFIPAAEASGVIEEIGAWVVDAVCRQVRAWEDGGLAMHVALNASPRELARAAYPARLAQALHRHGIAPERLMVEVTEGAAMGRPERTDPALAALGALGVRLAIDDFGTEHSSLQRLRSLPVDAVKIDRSFLHGVPEDPSAAAVIRALVGLGEALGLRVVAEGIETAAQQEFLVAAGCEFGQGFHVGRPMPADALAALA